jgi:hypothetical protein
MERRSLIAGINSVPNADPEEVRRFVAPESSPNRASAPQPSPVMGSANVDSPPDGVRRRRSKSNGVVPVGLIPVTVRLSPEIAGALKRASLERQLAGNSVFTQQELVEEALTPWLRSHGYLRG